MASGSVMFDGCDVTDWAPETLAPAGMTLTPEGRRVFGTLSVADNLAMGAYSNKNEEDTRKAWERVYSLFPILHERRAQYAGTLSGGQQQMLAVGRALMSNPRLLLLDEPSLGLAPKIISQVFDLISLLRDQGVTLVVVEQNVSMALDIADRGYVLANGKTVASGTASELANSDVLRSAYLGGD